MNLLTNRESPLTGKTSRPEKVLDEKQGLKHRTQTISTLKFRVRTLNNQTFHRRKELDLSNLVAIPFITNKM
jgi:hypothetical protein